MVVYMDATQRYPAQTWEELQTRLAGSFTVRTRGLLPAELMLSGPEGEFGWVRSHGPSGAKVAAGPLNVAIESAGNAAYRMLADGTTISAQPANRSADHLEIRVGGLTYEARISFLRNRADVRSPEGEEVVRLKGNLTSRRYEVAFDPGAVGALPGAILLLYHVVTHRGRAFQTG